MRLCEAKQAIRELLETTAPEVLRNLEQSPPRINRQVFTLLHANTDAQISMQEIIGVNVPDGDQTKPVFYDGCVRYGDGSVCPVLTMNLIHILGLDIGNEDLDALRVDLADMTGQTIGKMESSLPHLLHAAAKSNWPRLFGEADALFDPRAEIKDSHAH